MLCPELLEVIFVLEVENNMLHSLNSSHSWAPDEIKPVLEWSPHNVHARAQKCCDINCTGPTNCTHILAHSDNNYCRIQGNTVIISCRRKLSREKLLRISKSDHNAEKLSQNAKT